MPHRRDEQGRFDKLKCRDKFKGLRNEGLFTPPSTRGTILMPSRGGGTDWGGVAIDPTTNRLVVKYLGRIPAGVLAWHRDRTTDRRRYRVAPANEDQAVIIWITSCLVLRTT